MAKRESNYRFHIVRSPFIFRVVPFQKKHNQYELVGITKLNSDYIHPSNSKYSALAFRQNKTAISARIIQNQQDSLFEEDFLVVGGFFTILKDNQIIEYADIKNNRTAVGIDDSGTILYIMHVNASLPISKNGLSYSECAKLLQKLGVTDAIQLDGGSSTNLQLSDEYKMRLKIKNPIYSVKIPAAIGFRF